MIKCVRNCHPYNGQALAGKSRSVPITKEVSTINEGTIPHFTLWEIRAHHRIIGFPFLKLARPSALCLGETQKVSTLTMWTAGTAERQGPFMAFLILEIYPNIYGEINALNDLGSCSFGASQNQWGSRLCKDKDLQHPPSSASHPRYLSAQWLLLKAV
jgi:hypothetical protein